jgi:hypothetical protein
MVPCLALLSKYDRRTVSPDIGTEGNIVIDYKTKWLSSETLTASRSGGRQFLRNEHTWRAGIEAARSSDPQLRRKGWTHLGYVLHLLQDLTSPAHVRSDAHPLSDPIEGVIRNPSLPIGQGLVELPLAEDYFIVLQQWTQSRFFSADTVFAKYDLNGNALAGPEAFRFDAESGYVYDAANEPIALLGRSARIAAALDLSNETVLRRGTVDRTIADRQWERLGPQAVLYTASMIYRFYKDVDRKVPCQILTCVEIEGVIGPPTAPSNPNYLDFIKEGDVVNLHVLADLPASQKVVDWLYMVPGLLELQIGSRKFPSVVNRAFTKWDAASIFDSCRYYVSASLDPAGISPPPTTLEFAACFTVSREVASKYQTAPLPTDYSVFKLPQAFPNADSIDLSVWQGTRRLTSTNGFSKYIGPCRTPWQPSK